MINSQNAKTLKFIIAQSIAHPIGIFFMFFAAFTWAADLSLRSIFLKKIFNLISLLDKNNLPPSLLLYFIGYVLSIVSVQLSFRLYSYFVEIKMFPDMKKKIVERYFSGLLDQSHSFYQNNFSGSLASRVMDLSNSTPEILQVVIDRFFGNVLALIIALATLWMVSSVFSLVIFAWTAIFTLVAFFCSSKVSDLSDAYSSYNGTLFGRIVDVLSNIWSVRMFCQKKVERDNIVKAMDTANFHERRLNWAFFHIWTFYDILSLLTQVLCLYLLFKGRVDNTTSVGDFALVLNITNSIYGYFGTIFRDVSQFTKYFGRISSALRILDRPPQIVDLPSAGEIVVRNGEIEFKDVSFNYSPDQSPLFQHKSLKIFAGQKVGLVGHSGSGKSTFANLILRLYEVSSGRIEIDGQDIKSVTQESLRRSISVIPQDTTLFHTNIYENIKYGRPEASYDEVILAAKKADIHEFITDLPNGYRTLVGERGSMLSGGQRQRIVIARAILKNAPILILDEATSQLDSITENLITKSIEELMKNKTTLVIAHRLSTIAYMDRILVFEHGKIVQDGSHQELIGQEGLYANLWKSQVGGLIV